MQDSKRDISQILVDFGIYNQSGIASMRLDKELREYFASEISKAREEEGKKFIEIFSNLKKEDLVDRGFILAIIKEELSKLTTKQLN